MTVNKNKLMRALKHRRKLLSYQPLPTKRILRKVGFYAKNGKTVYWDGKLVRCEHKKQKTKCRECGGSRFCQHGKYKNYCRECGGSAFCQHGKDKKLVACAEVLLFASTGNENDNVASAAHHLSADTGDTNTHVKNANQKNTNSSNSKA